MWEAAQRLRLSKKERELLESFARAGSTPQKSVLRLRIVLRSADGGSIRSWNDIRVKFDCIRKQGFKPWPNCVEKRYCVPFEPQCGEHSYGERSDEIRWASLMPRSRRHKPRASNAVLS